LHGQVLVLGLWCVALQLDVVLLTVGFWLVILLPIVPGCTQYKISYCMWMAHVKACAECCYLQQPLSAARIM
jgi:hypothetical protein